MCCESSFGCYKWMLERTKAVFTSERRHIVSFSLSLLSSLSLPRSSISHQRQRTPTPEDFRCPRCPSFSSSSYCSCASSPAKRFHPSHIRHFSPCLPFLPLNYTASRDAISALDRANGQRHFNYRAGRYREGWIDRRRCRPGFQEPAARLLP